MSEPTFAEVLGQYIDAALDDVHDGIPGVVLAYDAATQRARVQPAVRRVVSQGGEVTHERRPILPSVPILFAGGGGARTTYPVAAGDSVLLLVSSTPIDRWLAVGGSDVETGTGRRHDLTNAIALVGLRDARRPWASAPTDRMSIGYDAGASIGISPTAVRLGDEAATDAVMLRSDGVALQTALTNALATLNASPVTNAQAIAALGALQTALGVAWPVAATKVFAD